MTGDICKCGHNRLLHDSGGCCGVQWCPCSHLELTKPEDFNPLEASSPKSIP